jgi:aquaporin Z
LGAEAAGTFVLVFGVVGAAIMSADFDGGTGGLNVGFLGVALALGLAAAVGGYAFASTSGAHFNPAVTVGLAVAGRFAWGSVLPYVVAQALGGLAATSAVAAVAAEGPSGFFEKAQASGFASTGWDALSPGGFALGATFLIETISTAVLLLVVLGSTRGGAAGPLAPLAIGLTLTVVALVAIPVSNGSFNPARSLATAVWGGALPMGQLWLSVLAPTLGAITAGLLARPLLPFASRGTRSALDRAEIAR